MTLTTAAPVKQAIVAAIRANTAFTQDVPETEAGFHRPSSGIYEGFAPAKKPYPFLVYSLVYNAYDFLWEDKVMSRSGIDIMVFAENSVEANNLNALVIATLNDAELTVPGQSLLYLRLVTDISSVDEDEEGKRIYQIGNSYSIWTDQSL